jgi:alcohol dehydrogenase class IV
MAAFEFYSVGRVVIGSGTFARIGEIAAPLGRRTLVISNAHDEANAALAGHLAKAGLHAVILPQRGEPTVADVEHGLDAARGGVGGSCDLVIGLGGGSAIDTAKAVAGLLANGGGPLDYMEVVGRGQKIARPAVPWIAIPCTAGTGAEATRNAVIGYPEKNFKASLRSEHLLARVALIDPELGVPVRPDVTARSGMDALCQCIEAYTSSGATALTDPLALEGVRRAGRSLKAAYTDGTDLAAREDMALAAFLSGVALTNAGLGAVHGFAAPLGATFPVPHGAVCAALLPPVIAANAAALREAGHPTLARYATLGRTLTDNPALDDHAAIQSLITFTSALANDLQIPRLGTFGIREADVPQVVAAAKKASSMRYNPVPLSTIALTSVLTSAL